MFYAVTDRNNKDAENPIVDVFTFRAKAEEFQAELEPTRGFCEIVACGATGPSLVRPMA